MPRHQTSKQEQQSFISAQVQQLDNSAHSEEEIVARLVHKFGKPYDGNTDWWRHEIRRFQGRRKTRYEH